MSEIIINSDGSVTKEVLKEIISLALDIEKKNVTDEIIKKLSIIKKTSHKNKKIKIKGGQKIPKKIKFYFLVENWQEKIVHFIRTSNKTMEQ